jgi:magnesium transporter
MTSSVFYRFEPSGLSYRIANINDAIAAVKDEGFVWFNFYKPDKVELSSLIGLLGIHPLSVEDCFDMEQVPKVEHFMGNTFIIFNSFLHEGNDFFIDEIDIFLGKNYLITVRGNDSGNRDPLNKVEGMIEKGHGYVLSGPDFLMHLIIDYIVDQKYEAFDKMEDDLEEAEEMLIQDVEGFQPLKLIHLRKNLMRMRKSLFHERDIMVKICRGESPYISEKAIIQYRDIYDHIVKFNELTESYHEIETSLMELYTSLLNNLMTRMSNETNTSVRRLTMIATIFMPLTLIAGIGGMSEWTMMTGPEKWKISYPLFILGMGIIAIINYYLIKRFEKK